MANVQTLFGFRPVRHADGAPWNGQTQRCYISVLYDVALFMGDPILLTPTLAEKDASVMYPTINLAPVTSGAVYRGVITSFEPLADNLTLQYNPAYTERWAQVCLSPDIVFQIRDDGSGTPAPVFTGQNAITVAGSGNTITGISGYSLDASTPTNTQAHNVHIIGLSDISGNELGDYAVWDVLINTCYNTTGRILGINTT